MTLDTSGSSSVTSHIFITLSFLIVSGFVLFLFTFLVFDPCTVLTVLSTKELISCEPVQDASSVGVHNFLTRALALGKSTPCYGLAPLHTRLCFIPWGIKNRREISCF
ncbi:hypothetical protein RRG08_065473 [Elysia crispata]|uniref:Uncharacterized protein n=1 Tax=Elysia crispata TaxID=231223 RepID=A0AAE1ARD6_9GAST|nr:hypothetical protein RRG08_065473 [Elysia crispata]